LSQVSVGEQPTGNGIHHERVGTSGARPQSGPPRRYEDGEAQRTLWGI